MIKFKNGLNCVSLLFIISPSKEMFKRKVPISKDFYKIWPKVAKMEDFTEIFIKGKVFMLFPPKSKGPGGLLTMTFNQTDKHLLSSWLLRK